MPPLLADPSTRTNVEPFQTMHCQTVDEDRARCVHVMPSGEVKQMDELRAAVQKTVPFHAIVVKFLGVEVPIDCWVHVTPSGDVAAGVDVVLEEPVDTAQKTVPFHAMHRQTSVTGSVCSVQLTPSGDVAAMVPEVAATAQKTLPFHARPDQRAVAGSVCGVQLMPSGDVAATLLSAPTSAFPPESAQNSEPFQTTLVQRLFAAGVGNVIGVQVTPSSSE